jgi:cytochrome P450
VTTRRRQVPAGPEEKYSSSQGLLSWIGEQFERFGDIYKASIDGTNVYVIRDPSYAEHVLRERWQNYVKGQAVKRIALLLGNGLVVSEGELWKRQRRMIQPAIHGNAIAILVKTMTTGNDELLKAWEQAAKEDRSINVTNDISRMILKVLLIAIFGKDYDHVGSHFNILSEQVARSLEFAQSFRLLGRVVLQVVARRREEKTISGDLLGLLMEARDRDTGRLMPDRQLVNEIMTLIVAGHETTASTLNWIWYSLSQNQDVEAKLSSELDDLCGSEIQDLANLPKFTYTRQVIDEALRMYPALWLIPRRALKDDQLGDYFVPAGTEIYIFPYFIQRHPNLWDEPDRFNPDRFLPNCSRDRHPLAMLPFSAGPRNCVGESLARVEMQIHLMMVAKRLLLRYAEAKPPELDVGVNLRTKHDLIMTPEIKIVGKP